jgi:hypothetical protein
MQEEIWKDIPGYEGYYQVSDLGRVRGLDRVVHYSDGKTRFQKGRILKHHLTKWGYLQCGLTINGIQQFYLVHQLVAIVFMNHKPNGHSLVIDHINGKKDDNILENLQIVTNRHNVSKGKTGTSKYTGVSWNGKKWVAQIKVNRKTTYLGVFADETEASLTYQNALKELA